MAPANYFFQQNSQHGIILRNGLNGMEVGRANIDAIFGTMNAMLSGASTVDTSYDEIVTRFGFPSTAIAHAAYNELNSLKTAVDGIGATLVQAFNRFR